MSVEVDAAGLFVALIEDNGFQRNSTVSCKAVLKSFTLSPAFNFHNA
jgi:hypothetical protein